MHVKCFYNKIIVLLQITDMKEKLTPGHKYSIHFNFILGIGLSEESVDLRSASFNTGKFICILFFKQGHV